MAEAIVTITFPDKERAPLDGILLRLAGDLKQRLTNPRTHNLNFGDSVQPVPANVLAGTDVLYIVAHGSDAGQKVGGLPPKALAYVLLAGCKIDTQWSLKEIHLVSCYGGAQRSSDFGGGDSYARDLRDALVHVIASHKKHSFKVVGYKGFVQDVSPSGEAVVIPKENIRTYEEAYGEVPQEYAIEAEIKGGFELVKMGDLKEILSTFSEYAPYEVELRELKELAARDTGGLVKQRIKEMAKARRRKLIEDVYAAYRLPSGKERQTYAYDAFTLSF